MKVVASRVTNTLSTFCLILKLPLHFMIVLPTSYKRPSWNISVDSLLPKPLGFIHFIWLWVCFVFLLVLFTIPYALYTLPYGFG